jgi:preprotein translocase subunit SecF
VQIFKNVPTIDFVGWRKAAMLFSAVLLLVSVGSLATRGLEFGLDFTGGTDIEIGYADAAELEPIRKVLASGGFPEAVVQHFGSSRDVLIRIAPKEEVNKAELSSSVIRTLRSTSDKEITLRRVEFVGPQVGEELREQGGLAMLLALGAILIYVTFRFEYRFAVGSVAALAHDVVVTLGFFSVMGLEFNLTVLAAVLAVIGYSLNDTIVVFDRVRENFRKMRRGTSEQVVNESLNQTLSRTLMTSLTTLLVLIALFFLGGELIHNFSTALIVGVVIGTYSSVYVASSTVLAMGISKADLMPVAKEDAGLDTAP